MKNLIKKSILTLFLVLISAPSITLAANTTEDSNLTNQVQELVAEVQQVALNDMLEAKKVSKEYVTQLENKAYSIMALIVNEKSELAEEDNGNASDKLIQCLEVIALYK